MVIPREFDKTCIEAGIGSDWADERKDSPFLFTILLDSLPFVWLLSSLAHISHLAEQVL